MNLDRAIAGRRGGVTTLRRYGHGQMAEWGKLGGRPLTLPLGEYANYPIARGYEIGRPRDTNRFILLACVRCGKERWVRLLKGKPETMYCRQCASKSRTKGRRVVGHKGYIQIKLEPDNFFYSMARADGYVMEHRLVMAQRLCRPLESWEAVHHKNGKRADNRLENLELTTTKNHISDHNKGYSDGLAKGFRDGRSQRIQQLEAEVAALKTELSTIRNNTSQKV